MKQEIKTKKNLEELVGSVLSENLEAPAGLLAKIMSAIFWRQRLYAGLRVSGLVLSLVGSCVVLFFAFKEVSLKMSQSGAWNILSLLFSDLEIVMANWQAFSLSFLEALPIFPIILTTGAILVILTSFRFILKNLLQINRHPNFKNKLLIKV